MEVEEKLGGEGFELGGCTPHRKRARRVRRGDRSAGQRGMEGVGDHGQIGQFGHGRAIVAVRRRVLDSPGPKGHGSSASDIEPIRRTKERTAELDHHGPPDRFGHGLSVAQAVRDSRARIHHQE